MELLHVEIPYGLKLASTRTFYWVDVILEDMLLAYLSDWYEFVYATHNTRHLKKYQVHVLYISVNNFLFRKVI